MSEELSNSTRNLQNNIPTARADEVKTLLCRGLDRTTILQYGAQNQWEATPEQVDDWISAAQMQLAEDAAAIDTQAEIGKSIARYNWLFLNATKVQDIKTARAIQNSIDKLLALKLKADAAKFATGTNRPTESFRLTVVK